jgi:hypothetical protein
MENGQQWSQNLAQFIYLICLLVLLPGLLPAEEIHNKNLIRLLAMSAVLL